jgi:uncharacterized metal-binding protein
MKNLFIGNAFSLSMITPPATIIVKEVTTEEVNNLLENYEYKSCIGHESTAALISKILKKPISVNRVSIKLEKGDKLVVFQLLVRLQEGTVLGEEELANLPFRFYLIDIIY